MTPDRGAARVRDVATFWVLDSDNSRSWSDAIEVEARDHEAAACLAQDVWESLEEAAQVGNPARAVLWVASAAGGDVRVFRVGARVSIEYEVREDLGAEIDADPKEG